MEEPPIWTETYWKQSNSVKLQLSRHNNEKKSKDWRRHWIEKEKRNANEKIKLNNKIKPI